MNLRKETEEACEQIDAAIFSGDEFADSTIRRTLLRNYIHRWEKALDEFAVCHFESMAEEFHRTGVMPDSN